MANDTNNNAANNSQSGTGLQPNISATLSYLFGFVTGLIFFLIEKDNKFVKFHAMQSTITSLGFTFVYFFFMMFAFVLPSFLSLLMWCLISLMALSYLGLMIFLMYKAYSNEKFMLPLVGSLAEKLSNQ
ncbi:MAG: membrane protein [Candidatus Dojkabacteria bacterium]|nr:MAG: membrane protein [Candidatus Dojkabacteria bacterium]